MPQTAIVRRQKWPILKMDKPLLWRDSKDPKILDFCDKIDALRKEYDPLPNGYERAALWAKCNALVLERRAYYESLQGQAGK